jgi:hypothetical protein
MSNTDPKRVKDEEMFAKLKAEMKLFLARTAEGGAAAGVAAIGEYERELAKERRKDTTNKLLDERGGDKDWLIEDLLNHIEKDIEGQRATPQRQQTQPVGRPARRFGPAGAAIPSIVQVIDVVQELMLEDGITKPTIADAIALIYGIPAEKRLFDSNVKKINNMESVYSRGKKSENKNK